MLDRLLDYHLNSDNAISFSASNVALESGKKLYVKIDRARTAFDNDLFKLQGPTDYIGCEIKVGSLNDASLSDLYETEYIATAYKSCDLYLSQ